MTEVFSKFVFMSIHAGILVLPVVLLRFIFRKAPKWIHCLMWLLVGLRLIFPFTIESAFSLMPSEESVSSTYLYEQWMPTESAAVYESPAAAGGASDHIWDIAGAVWLIGICFMLLYTLVSYFRLRQCVRTATVWKGNLYQCERVKSPFILGIIRPKIYLPYHISEEAAELITAHENAHIKRKDHWIKPIGFLLLTVYWFHPLLWLAYILLCRDIEAACDEKVVSYMETDRRQMYSELLLACSVKRRSIAACPLAFGEVSVKTRVKAIMNYRKPAFWVMIAAILVCVVTGICFLTTPEQKQQHIEISESLDQYISREILRYESNQRPAANPLDAVAALCENHKILQAEYTAENEITVYTIVFYGEYDIEQGQGQRQVAEKSASHYPAAITVKMDSENRFSLCDYRVARDGKLFEEDVKKIFPKAVRKDAMEYVQCAEQQREACVKQAESYFGVKIVPGTYYCENNNPMGASVYLSEDGTFNLTRSFSSSSAVIGTYEIRCGKLVLKAEDDVVFRIDGNQWVEEKGLNFVFRIDGDQLIYEAGASSGGLQDGSIYYREAE